VRSSSATTTVRWRRFVYRFEHFAEIEVFRASTAAVALLGSTGAEGESFAMVHPIKTFAP
jgi:hypothetical protein